MTCPAPLSSVRLILPVKPLGHAKSRLKLSPHDRRLVAERLFVNTLTVALQCLQRGQVFVLTSDDRIAARAGRQGVTVVADAGDDLNGSLDAAIRSLNMKYAGDTLAVMVSDLPRLDPRALTGALLEGATVERPRHIVDHRGGGTTFVSMPPRARIPMCFGVDSARRFREAGSVPMPDTPDGITHDLDVLSDMHPLSTYQRECLGLPQPSSGRPRGRLSEDRTAGQEMRGDWIWAQGRSRTCDLSG